MKGHIFYLILIIYFYAVLTVVLCEKQNKNNKNVTEQRGQSVQRKSGPYRAILLRSEMCPHPSRPIIKNPPGVFYLEIYNTTKRSRLVRGNATMTGKWIYFQMDFKGYYMEGGKWRLRFFYNKVSCNGVFFRNLMPMFGLNFNKECSIPPGVYVYDNLDFDKVEHMVLSSKREYGRLLWRVEAYNRNGVIICWETETEVVPK